MKLILRGQSNKAAAEQAMLNFFPPWVEGEAESSFEADDGCMLTSTRIVLADGRTSSKVTRRTGSYSSREADSLIKECFYLAALPLLTEPPPWGSLTGIRPVKLAAKEMLRYEGFHPDHFPRLEEDLMSQYHVEPERCRLMTECARFLLDERKRLQPLDISLYVGIPFCPSRCAYCSFVSNDAVRSHKLIQPYLDRLTEEIAMAGRTAGELGLRPVTLYIGGGTPTVLEADDLRRLMDALHGAFDLTDCIEITVEAGRPDTLTMEKLWALRESGVTRVSVNPQSMRDEVLEAIGRKHTVRQVYDAFALARRAGFPSLNADLIAGLPCDDPAGFIGSLEALLALEPENLTIHTLALKKGAAVWDSPEKRLGAEDVRKMLDGAYDRLRGERFKPYYLYRQKFMAGGFENTGWTLPGHASRYNLHMMEELTTVLAMGTGVTKTVRPTGDPEAPYRIDRIANCKFPLEYLEKCDKIERNLNTFKALMEGKTATHEPVL